MLLRQIPYPCSQCCVVSPSVRFVLRDESCRGLLQPLLRKVTIPEPAALHEVPLLLVDGGVSKPTSMGVLASDGCSVSGSLARASRTLRSMAADERTACKYKNKWQVGPAKSVHALKKRYFCESIWFVPSELQAPMQRLLQPLLLLFAVQRASMRFRFIKHRTPCLDESTIR